MAPCLKLIRKGVKAYIRGKDLRESLEEMIKEVLEKGARFSFIEFVRRVELKNRAVIFDLQEQGLKNLAREIEDQLETFLAICSGLDSFDQLESRLKILFDDSVPGVLFSTIHRSKGLEAKRVFILSPDLLSSVQNQVWKTQQEKNLHYVAVTRAQETLVYVQEPVSSESENAPA